MILTTFNDKAYWVAYYDKLLANNKNKNPSPFAQSLVEQGYLKGKSMVELGCGNGRDALFFAKNGAIVTAIDQCENTTQILNNYEGVTSYASDFTNLEPVITSEKFDLVYSRFTIHSIDEEGENRVLNWAFSNLKKGGKLCVEARTLKDPICGKGEDKGSNVWFYNEHHRRFIDAAAFRYKLQEVGFDLVFFQEKNGFAKYKEEDPIVLRMIALKP